MKNIIPTLAFVAATLCACQGESGKTLPNSGTATTAETGMVTNMYECFVYTKNRDTGTLKLLRSGSNLSGELSYSLDEKDRNNGSIKGIVKGDTIIADYNFNSEGANSTRQVVWIKKDGKLIEGFGETEEVKGQTRFKNLGQLSYSNSIEFTPTECK